MAQKEGFIVLKIKIFEKCKFIKINLVRMSINAAPENKLAKNELKLIKMELIFRILHISSFFILSTINLSFGAVIYLFILLHHTRNRLLR